MQTLIPLLLIHGSVLMDDASTLGGFDILVHRLSCILSAGARVQDRSIPLLGLKIPKGFPSPIAQPLKS